MTEPITLKQGESAPQFSAFDQQGNTHTLEEYLSQGKSVILYFYPKDSTPGCTTQACDFRDNLARLQQGEFVVFGVSKDSARSHENFAQKQQLNFPLLLDEDLSLHHAYGTWREKLNYGKSYMGCARSTFVIQPNGTLSWCRYNVKAKGHVEMLLRELNVQ